MISDALPAKPPWRPARAIPRLPREEVHVWRAPLSAASLTFERGYATLAGDELARAARFRRLQDRNRFLLARVMVRAIVGSCYGLAPQQVRLGPDARGKPRVLTTDAAPAVRFNVSHAGDWVYVAVARRREIGIDVEGWRDDVEFEALARRFFAVGEYEALQRLPSVERIRGFFDCWCRKEAFVKATGLGLSAPLREFEVSLAAGEPARLLRVDWEPAEQARWSILDLKPASGYSAALVVEGHGWRLRCWDWSAECSARLPGSRTPSVR